MRKFYEIIKIDDATLLIISKSFESPLGMLDKIEKDIMALFTAHKKSWSGLVVFDLLLSNGASATNRFFQIEVFNFCFQRKTALICNCADHYWSGKLELYRKINRAAHNFWDQNNGLLKFGVLSDNEIEYITTLADCVMADELR